MTEMLRPGATIGILGGGQLGRMLAIAAARLGLQTHIYTPDSTPPAQSVATKTTQAAYDDLPQLGAFARSVDVVTFEFENIPDAAAGEIEKTTPVRPGKRALGISQDRLVEKDFLNSIGLQTAAYTTVASPDALIDALALIGRPAILKTRRLGYDGKGQIVIREATDLAEARALTTPHSTILERMVDFSSEISVIGARSADGSVVCFDPGENHHQNGILRTTTVPARLSTAQMTDAVIIAGRILNALDYVGVLGVELFVTPQGLLVNEIAPRVHNSGHWTQDGCMIDQFEQHIRAIAGWPLGDGQRHSDIVMTNLIGDDVLDLDRLAAESDTGVHLYGKADVRPNRKMGHVNRST